ncbi:MAG TPA: DJ-1/PfpI family protein [Blastocatellia bacterium]|nr:DJ-1/PfpI family protein [Blastocatellia bacterium]
MKQQKETTDAQISRRTFVTSGASTMFAMSYLHGIVLDGASAEAQLSRSSAAKVYVCPPCGLPCDKLTYDKPGDCPSCGMKLVPVGPADDSPPAVAVLLYNGVEIIDIAGPWEVFGAAGFLVHTVAEKLEPLTLVFGQKVLPDYTFDNSPKADILLVPGGGYEPSMKNQRLIDWIKAKSNDARFVMSVCTGAFLLGKAGLLDGQRATCTYGMVEELSAFPNTKVVYDARYVDSGKIITTAGLTSGIDGAIHLVSKMLGKGEAQSVALNVEYHWDSESSWARGAMADKYLPDGLAYAKPRIKGVQAQMISTEGDSEHWETKLLVSEPSSPTEIISLLRERIPASGVGGMVRRISHLRGAPTLSQQTNKSQIKWKFIDEDGNGWSGMGLVEPAADAKEKFVVTLKLTRDSKPRSAR